MILINSIRDIEHITIIITGVIAFSATKFKAVSFQNLSSISFDTNIFRYNLNFTWYNLIFYDQNLLQKFINTNHY